MMDNMLIVKLVLAWVAGAVPFAILAYLAHREANRLMDYILAGEQGRHSHTGDVVLTSASAPIDPSAIELDRATRIYQSALMRGEIGESDLDELARAGGVTEPVRQ